MPTMLHALSYDDVILVPQFSEIQSRSDPDTSFDMMGITGLTPIISANMDTITESEMAITMYNYGAMGALHRFMRVEDNVTEYCKVKASGAKCMVTVGVRDWKERASALFEVGAELFIIDIAHGHSALMRDALEGMRKRFGHDITIVAGNVATPEGVRGLKAWGADIVKIGVGGGSICKTRMVTGHGVPMFSSVMECSRVAKLLGMGAIADGGIRTSGDIVKAFAAGCDCVMLGSLLAGTTETPGQQYHEQVGDTWVVTKRYRGMASAEARADRQWGSNDLKTAPEGVETMVPHVGSVVDVVNELTMGLKSGMSYCNARKLDEIYKKAVWRTQTYSGYIEGTPHILGR